MWGSPKSGSTAAGAEGVVAAGDDLVEVDEADVLLLGDLLGPAAIGIGLADDVAVQPDFAGDERADDGRGALGLDVGDVFAEIPAVGVDGFDLAGAGVGTSRVSSPMPGRLPPTLGPRGAAPGGGAGGAAPGGQAGVGDGRGAGEVDAAVVVAPLDEDEVAGLDDFESEVPVAAGRCSCGWRGRRWRG